MDSDPRFAGAHRALRALAPAIRTVEEDAPPRGDLQAACDRGHFLPHEDDALRVWFARYLTARAGLMEELIRDLRPVARRRARGGDDERHMRAFVLAYTAACLLVRAARFLVEYADHEVIRRKLDEAEPRYRIPRRQFTAIYRSLTMPINAWYLAEAMQTADTGRDRIEALGGDPDWRDVLDWLESSEEAIRVDVRPYLKARLRYRWHSWRRRRRSAFKRTMFGVSEHFGRVIADVRNPWHRPRVKPRHRRKLAKLLRPGDVIVTRHDDALSNLFLPGFWPHASLHIGLPETRNELGLAVPAPQLTRWVDPLRVLEARKDGVLFRALADTLHVDSVAVLRPKLSTEEIARGLINAIVHEGKLYNFDFDFFTADRLVCTEVIYRAYEGVGDVHMPLQERAGRPTLSAEDLIGFALEGRMFEPVAVYGVPGSGRRLLLGDDAALALRSVRGDDPR